MSVHNEILSKASSPDPTYEREGLVTSGWYLGLH